MLQNFRLQSYVYNCAIFLEIFFISLGLLWFLLINPVRKFQMFFALELETKAGLYGKKPLIIRIYLCVCLS
jgi:hypothetical protein